MPLALDQFVKNLEDSGIISPSKLQAVRERLPVGKEQDVQELARELVRQKRLTKFQAQEAYQGKAKNLVLGNYVILDKIGAGGMGQVYKAQHRVMERIVAVKVLPAGLTKDKAAVERFHREVKAAAKLNHPNIVTAYDADQAGSVHFLVMEYVEGSDLSALVKKSGPLSVVQAIDYIQQAARGLEFAHKKGVIHRDIKPGNLLLDTEGTVKILDMGLARIDAKGDAPTQAELTGTGAVMGTVDYMAPEQAMNTKTADARADIYSLGCTLFYLVRGKPVFEGETLTAKLIAHQTQPAPALFDASPEGSPQRSDSDEQLAAIFQKMVAKTLDARYQSLTEVIADLERLRGGSQQSVSVPDVKPSGDTGLVTFLRDIPARSTARRKSTNRATTGTAGEAKRPVGSQRLLYGSLIGGTLALVGIPLALYFAFGGGPQKEPQSPNPASEITQPLTALDKLPRATPIDLFQHIDVAKGGVDGKGMAVWEWKGNPRTLVCNTGNIDRALPIDFPVPTAYVLEATVDFRPLADRAHRLNIGLRSEDHRFALQLDASLTNQPEIYSGLSLVDGKHAMQNETRFAGAVLTDGQPHTIRIEVRPNAVIAAVDGRQLVDFRGKQDRLSFPFPKKNDVNGIDISLSDLWLMVHDKITFRSLTLTPLAPGATASHSRSAGDYALLFDGDDVVNFTQPLKYVPDSCTIEAYVRVDAYTPRAWVFSPSGNSGLGLDTQEGKFWRLSHVQLPSGHFAIDNPARPIELARRVHVAGVCSQQRFTLYVDGKQTAQSRPRGKATFAELMTTLPKMGFHHRGLIDELRVSSKPRYTAEFTPPPRHAADADTLALWHFDEGTGDTLRDSSANGHDGKITGAMWVNADGSAIAASLPGNVPAESPSVPGVAAGYALDFNHIGNFVATPVMYDGTHPLTVEAYVTTTPTWNGSIIGAPITDFPNLLSEGSRLWEFSAQNSENPNGSSTSVPAKPAGQRVHLACVYDGRYVWLFVDGVPQPRKGIGRMKGPLRPLTIGTAPDDPAVTAYRGSLRGPIDEVRISKSARYDGLFKPEARFAPDADTLALYHFDEGIGDFAQDDSGNGNHARVYGPTWKFVGTPGAETETGDPDRQAANWVFSVGGTVYVESAEGSVEIATADKLPSASFVVVGVFILGQDGPVPDLSCLQGLTRLQSLSLVFFTGGNEAAQQIATLTTLRSLNVAECGLSASGLAHLRSLTELRFLNLERNPITDGGVAPLAEFPHLLELSLSDTPITGEGLQHLDKLPLCSLSVRRTKVTDATIAHLARVKSLTVLNLDGTEVFGAGIAHLKTLPKLESLSLHSTRVDDGAMVHIKSLPKLQYLDLWQTGVSDAGLEQLAQLANLRHVNVMGTQVTAAGAAQFERARPGSKVSWKTTIRPPPPVVPPANP